MQEQVKQQHIPVKVYRTGERLMIAAPMAGLEPENMLVEVTHDGRLILHGDQRAMLKEVKELLVDEWSVGVYHRELALPVPVNAVCANVTYGNGVLLVAIWVEWCVTHPKEFQRAEDDIVEKVEETSAETPGDPESAPKVLS